MAAYLNAIQITIRLRSPGGSNSRMCVMSLAKFTNLEQLLDRAAPTLFVGLGLVAAAAMALIGA
jgi:hypothetical protein